MMKQFFLTLLFFFSSSILLFSHEFWLHPTKFIYEPGELITIKLLVGENYEGENYEGENWSGTNKSIENLQLHFPGTTDELSEKIGETPGDSLQFSIHDEGTYLLSYHSTNKFIELDPKKFNEYLNEDGLQNTIDYRLAHHETDSVGREYYQRSVKTIFQVGAKKTALYKKQTSLPLDIVPLQNPYELKKTNSDTFTVKVLFQKKILSNQVVIVWHRLNGKTIKEEFKTNERGQLSFPVSEDGRWMVSTVKMERIINDSKAQWQSYWGSCTWGYE